MSAKKPTLRQQKLVEKLGGKDGNPPKSIAQALREANYSPAIVNNPQKVIRSTGFQLALEQAGITDEKLTKILDEGLLADKLDGKHDELRPDYAVRHRYLETALRVKGLVKTDESGNTYNTFIQQNNLDPNTPESKKLVDDTLEYLMDKTRVE